LPRGTPGRERGLAAGSAGLTVRRLCGVAARRGARVRRAERRRRTLARRPAPAACWYDGPDASVPARCVGTAPSRDVPFTPRGAASAPAAAPFVPDGG